jgi:hypothetical protein
MMLPCPPANKTVPSGIRIAACRSRRAVRLPVAANLPMAGSSNSALSEGMSPGLPPAIKTFPFMSKVAVPLKWPVIVSPRKANVPAEGS